MLKIIEQKKWGIAGSIVGMLLLPTLSLLLEVWVHFIKLILGL